MIICFSATGNSRHIADRLANKSGDKVVDIRDCRGTLPLAEGESVGFVFPVHSWGLPKHLSAAISQLRFRSASGHYCYMVCTCGDDTGLTAREWERAVAATGLTPAAEYSVQMPNTYVLLPGFDVDDKALEDKKIAAVGAAVEKISRSIAERVSGDYTHHGGFAFIKSKIIRPLFMRFMGDRQFRADRHLCTGCGLCARSCPLANITVDDGKPRWRGTCINCLACYHRCPHKAISYGTRTKNKGQYYFRNQKID